jgi:uncharacterized membrane protein
MKTENAALMNMARESLKDKWGIAVGATLVLLLSSIILQKIPVVGPIISILVSGPLTLGFAGICLSISRNQPATVQDIATGFSHFATALGAYLLVMILVILWALLLIVPGIVAAISYSMTFFLLAEDSSLTPMEAINKSKQMMDGYKLKYFYLCLKFIGWALLCCLTLGIGFLWLIPYIQVSTAKFYDELKGSASGPQLV